MPHATGRDGTKIHYTIDAGDGPVVVLVQGLGLSSSFWGDVPDTFRNAPEKFRVLLVDNRAAGRSDLPRGPFTTEHMADDVASVLDHAGVENAFVGGISMGGMIAQHVALRHPRKVRGLVLMATTPGLPHGRLPELSALSMLARVPFARERARREALYARMFFAGQAPDESRRLASFLMSVWDPIFARERLGPRAYFLQFTACASHAASRALGRIACPTHVITGSADRIVHPRNSEILASRIPGATLEVLPDLGHALPVQDREAMLRAIRRVA